MPFHCDVLGLGCLAVDELLVLPHFPSPDTKTRLISRDRQGGGLTGNALVAAARQGARCAYAGPLGTDSDSTFLRELFTHEGVDLSWSRTSRQASPIRSTILVDQSGDTRTILFDLAGSVGCPDDWPPEEVITAARVLFVDHYGIEGMTRAALIARAAGIPVVADLERNEWPGFDKLLALVDHLIVTHAFATRLTGETDPVRAVGKLWAGDREVVVVTCGAQGCHYQDRLANRVRHVPVFAVEVVDTTGCGDAFHGSYAADLATGLPLGQRLVRASATAALKAAHLGAQRGLPTRAQVDAFMIERRGRSSP